MSIGLSICARISGAHLSKSAAGTFLPKPLRNNTLWIVVDQRAPHSVGYSGRYQMPKSNTMIKLRDDILGRFNTLEEAKNGLEASVRELLGWDS